MTERTAKSPRLRIPLLSVTSALLAFLIPGAFTGCKPTPAETQPTASTAPRLLGQIASVASDRKFVLIESYGPWTIESGTILTTRGQDNRSANLLVTGETLGRLAAADIQSGEVLRGDQVFSLHTPKPPSNAAENDTSPAPEPPRTPAEKPQPPPLPSHSPQASRPGQCSVPFS